ncbi:MAG TPA: alpha/beta hydrolase [Candidatus Limnocylindrales bacterium]|nr:alpha/beta hydrolase [Candidatus Limnocylindrales bacterium]
MRRLCARLSYLLLVLVFSAGFSSLPARAQSSGSTDVQSGLAEIDGTKIYYEVAGTGHPLVLIHGGQMDSRMWDDQFHLFSKTYRVVRYDVRGYGKSPASKNIYASEDDLAALLKFLKIDKAHVLGLSLGGRIAIDFALAHPEMTDGIVPVAPGLSGFHFSDDPNEWNVLRAVQSGDFAKAADYWLQSGYMAPAMENPKIAPRLRQLSLENVHENLDNPLLETMPNPPAIERLPQIKAPTLILVGNRDVADIHEICGLLRARIPGAKEIVIEGSGHIVNMEKPEEFNRAVLEFLASLPK